MSKSAPKHSSKRPSFQKTSIREDQVQISFLKAALLGSPNFDLSDTVLNSRIALVAGVGSLLAVVPSRREHRGVQVGAEELRGDLGFTRRRRGLALPAAAPPERFMGPGLLLSATSDL